LGEDAVDLGDGETVGLEERDDGIGFLSGFETKSFG